MSKNKKRFLFTYGMLSDTFTHTMKIEKPALNLFRSIVFLVVLTGCASVNTEEKIKESSAHYQLGVSYLNENNIQLAFVEFQKALKLNPNDKEVANAIGIVYLMKLEDYPQAAEYFQRALSLDKNFSEASNNLGLAYEKSGRYAEAVEAYKSALTSPVYRNAQKALNNLGRAYYRVKRYNDSIAAYKEAIRRSYDFHLPYYGLALSYNAIGKYNDAAIALQRGIEIDPAYKGDKVKALKDMREKKILLAGEEEKDLEDLLEIMNY